MTGAEITTGGWAKSRTSTMLSFAMTSSPGAEFGLAVRTFSNEAAALRPVVRAVIANVLGERVDSPDVEDCTHEALRRALEGRDRLRTGEPLRPWLLGIARHVALDARRARRRAIAKTAPEGEDAIEPLVDRVADPTPGPDERAETSERAQRVQSALDGLAADQRRALVLFHVEGRGYQEIAQELGVPMGTVATWLSRGRRAIADALGGER